MNKTKVIEKFIIQSIKKSDFSFDKSELKNLLDYMTTEEIQMFWFHYISKLAFSAACNKIPHWQTSRQEKHFASVANSLYYYPKNKDESGRYIVDRDDLIEHIISKLTTYINFEIQSKLDFRNQSLIEKTPFYLFVSCLIMIPVLTVCMVFQKNHICLRIVIGCSIYYVFCIATYPILKSIINKRKQKKQKLLTYKNNDSP